MTRDRPLGRCKALARTLLLSALSGALLLAACSNNSNRGVSGTVGEGTGVDITTPGSVTDLLAGATIVVSANVVTDDTGQGVTWTALASDGSQGALSAITTGTVTYTAPAAGNGNPADGGVNGALSVTLTATSKSNPDYYASVTLIVYGYPEPNNTPLFPANQNVAYAASISIEGGLSPYTWTLCATAADCGQVQSPGTTYGVPDGLVLNGSTGATDEVSGTPTTTATPGLYSFWVKVTDSFSPVRTAYGQYIIRIKPEYACLLDGQYVLYFAGFRGGGEAAHSATINIDQTTGNLTGEQDYKDGHRTTTDEALTSGVCTNHSTNTGTLTLNAPSGSIEYEFAATLPNAAGTLPSARLQLIGSGSDSGSGAMTLQDTTAYTASTALPANNYAFGLLGVENQEPLSVHFGSIGRFTTDTTGTLSAGEMDSTWPSATLSDATLTGTLSVPDAFGRGTLSTSAGSQNSTYVYYIVNASKMYLMDIDATVASPRLSGFLTTQTGDVTGASGTSFDNSALLGPSIMSLWGATGSTEPISVSELGRLSGGVAASGTLAGILDTSDQTVNTAPQIFSSNSYAVSTGGRGTLTLGNSTVTRNFVFYLDGSNDGYILEPASTTGNTGFLEAQYIPAASASGSVNYPDTFATYYAGGTQFTQAAGPVILMPLVTLNYGTLSSTYTTGIFAIDPTTGRGLGTINDTGVGEAGAAVYIVNPDKLDLLRFSYRSIDGSLSWFTDQ